MEKPDNAIRVPCSLSKSFFKYWFLFLKPYHNLTDREIDVAAGFVKERYELNKVITDKTLLDKILMGEDIKRKIREECNIKIPYFQVIMSKLRQNKVIVDGKINQKFIPRINEDSNSCTLLLYFDLREDLK